MNELADTLAEYGIMNLQMPFVALALHMSYEECIQVTSEFTQTNGFANDMTLAKGIC